MLADRDALAFVKLDRDATAKVVVNRVVITEGADVLGDRRKRDQRRKGAPRKVEVGMGRGDCVGRAAWTRE